jgi:hypothetical protein
LAAEGRISIRACNEQPAVDPVALTELRLSPKASTDQPWSGGGCQRQPDHLDTGHKRK